MTTDLYIFAKRHNCPASAAHVLPALFERIAKETGNKTRALINHATYNDNEMAGYIVKIAVKVADES
jgi:hypothetical protein